MMGMYTYAATQPAMNYYRSGNIYNPYNQGTQQWFNWGQGLQQSGLSYGQQQQGTMNWRGQSGINAGTNVAQQTQGLKGGNDPLGISSSITGLVSDIFAISRMGRETPQQHMERRKWERFQVPAHNVFESTFYNPNMAGLPVPYAQGNSLTYNWNPSAATQQVYSNYLNRTYGVPQSVANAQASQAMQPTRLGRLPDESASPAAMAAALSQHAARQAATLTNAQAGAASSQLQGQLDYLQNAAQLAAFNLQRAQTLPQLIG